MWYDLKSSLETPLSENVSYGLSLIIRNLGVKRFISLAQISLSHEVSLLYSLMELILFPSLHSVCNYMFISLTG